MPSSNNPERQAFAGEMKVILGISHSRPVAPRGLVPLRRPHFSGRPHHGTSFQSEGSSQRIYGRLRRDRLAQ